MQGSSDSLEPVDLLADEFLESQRRGEKPTIEGFCDRYPELAEEIREVFPALMIMEEVAPATGDLSVSNASQTSIGRLAMTQVGDYRILKEIGRGGMGVVYEAEQESLGRRVALKVLPRQSAGDENSIKRFQQEARAAARMHHTNIVPVFEVGESDDLVFYAMQLIHGQGLDLVVNDLRQLRSERIEGKPCEVLPPAHSLAASLVAGRFEKECLIGEDVQKDDIDRLEIGRTETIILNHGSTSTAKLPGQSEISSAENNRLAYFRSVAEIGLQAAQALSYAHARGIIHRDIKPSNLLLDTTGVVWITDFGLAKTDNSGMTQTGDILGTIRYMSPERFNGQCDVRTDIYALGLTLYEMLVLKPAFESPDRLKLMSMVTKEEATPPRSIDPRIPRDLETIVLKASDKDPRRRYQSADELADDLQRFVNDEPIRARRISLLERAARWSRHNKAIAGSLAFVATLITAVAIGSTLMAHRLSEEKRRADIAASEARAEAERADIFADQKATLADERKVALEEAIRLKKVADSALDESARQADITLRNLYAAEMKMSRYAQMADEVDRGKELLANWIGKHDGKDMRGWEWYQQSNAMSIPSKDIRLPGYDGMTDVAWSPDGKRLVASRFNGSVQIADFDGQGKVRELKPGFPWAVTADWSSNAHWVAAGGVNGAVRIWDATSGEVIYQFNSDSALIRCVRWSHDGKRLAVSGRDHAEIVDVEDRVHLTLDRSQSGSETESNVLDEIAWSADDRHVAARSLDSFRVYEASSGDFIAAQSPDVTDPDAISWHPSKDLLAVVDEEGTTRIWSLSEEDFIKEFPGDFANSYRVQWHPHDDRLAVLRSGEQIEVIDTIRGTTENVLPLEKDVMRYLSWHPSGEFLAGPAANKVIRVWGPLDRNPTEMTAATRNIKAVAWHPEGVILATGGDAETVELWDARDKSRLSTLIDPKAELANVQGIVFNETGDLVAAAGRLKDDVLIWNANTGKLVRRLIGPAYDRFASDNGIRVIDWCQRTNKIAAGNSDRRVYVWDVATGQLESTIQLESGSTQAIRFLPSSDGVHLLVSDGKGVSLWKTDGSSKVLDAATPEWVWDIAIDPSGTRVAVAYGLANTNETGLSGIGGVSLWEVVENGNAIEFANSVTLKGGSQRIKSVDFTKDGKRLLGAGADGSVFVWDASRDRLDQSRREIVTLETTIDKLASIRASSDGAKIVAVGDSDTPKLWDPINAFAKDLSPSLLPAIEKRELAGNANDADLALKARILAHTASWSAAIPTLDQLLENDPQTKWFYGDIWILDRPATVAIDEETPWEKLSSINEFNLADHGLADEASNGDFGESVGRWKPMSLQREIPVDLGSLFDAREYVSGYALLPVYAKHEQELGILLGADDQSRVWLNGELVFDDRSFSGPSWDEHGIPVRLQAGWNTVLLKVYNEKGPHGFFLTLSDIPRELGVVYSRSDHLEEALRMFNVSCERFSRITFPYIMRGAVLWRLGRREEAERDWEYARNLPNSVTFAHPFLSNNFWGACLSDRAIEEYTKILEEDQGNADHWYYRSSLFARLERFEEASHDLVKALQIDSTDELWWMSSMVLLQAQGEFQEYTERREEMIDSFAETEDPTVADRIVKASLLAAVDPATLERLEPFVNVMREAKPQNPYQRYYYVTRGLFQLQKGMQLLDRDSSAASKEFESALQQLNRAKARGLPENLDILSDSLAAMAFHYLGRKQQAEFLFASASEEVGAGEFPEPGEILSNRWRDQLIARRFFADAGRLLYGPGHDALLEGQRLMSDCRPQEAHSKFISALELTQNAPLIRSQVVEAFGTGVVGAETLIRPSKRRHEPWEYCSTHPETGWQSQSGTDDENWTIQSGPFATSQMNDTAVFPWPTKENLWIRKEFHLDSLQNKTAIMRYRVAGNADVWINGVLAASISGNWDQSEPLNQAGQAALREGSNVIAIQATGEPGKFRGFDLGLYHQSEERNQAMLIAIRDKISDSDEDALQRSQISAQLGDWSEAAFAMEKRISTLQNDRSIDWLRAGVLHAIAYLEGQESIDEYERVCAEMIQDYLESGTIGYGERTLKTCLLLDASIDTSALPVSEIADAIETETGGLRAWYNFVLSLDAYRNQSYDESLNRASLALTNAERLQNVELRECLESAVYAVVALAECGRRDLRAAQEALDSGQRKLRNRVRNRPDGAINSHDSVDFRGKIIHDALIARMLLNEAMRELDKTDEAIEPGLARSSKTN